MLFDMLNFSVASTVSGLRSKITFVEGISIIYATNVY